MQRIVLGILVLLWASPASAASVPLSYRVDAKALKAAVSGTELTFELYRDAACAQLHHSGAAAIDDLDFVSQLKLFKPKGGAKLPKSAELRHTLDGVPAAGNLYLRVSGTGITALGGTCQLQASAGTGRAGSTTVITDASGTLMGPAGDNGVTVLLKNPTDGRVFVANIGATGFIEGRYAYHESSDCSGTGYANIYAPSLYREAAGYQAGLLYVPGVESATRTTESRSVHPYSESQCLNDFGGGWTFLPPDGCCCAAGCQVPFTEVFSPLETMDVSQYTPPFRLELQ